MGINKYGAHLPGRLALMLNYLAFKDLAILEYSTQGHMVLNFGQYFNTSLKRRMDGIYNTNMGEMDIVLGVDDKLYDAANEIKEDGYRNIFLMPSALGNVMGFDLAYYAKDIGSRLDVNAFSAKIKSDASFYEGEEAFYNSLYNLIKNEASDIKYGYNIIGDLNIYINTIKHKRVAEFMNKYFNMDLVFDSLRLQDLDNINSILKARINICTSLSAIPLCKRLYDKYNIPYYYLSSLDLDSINEDIKNIENILSIKRLSELDYSDYNNVAFQFQNILDFMDKEIILYLNPDNLNSVSKLLSSFNKKHIAYSTVKSDEYMNPTIDEIIEKYNSSKYLIISNDIVKKYTNNSIALEDIRLDYSILTPIEIPLILEDGAYKVIKLIADKLFS